ncbi:MULTISPECIES: CocE/NonD family hydrolase [Nocardiaceae]|uniref:CocE/NonD family hydrolase n=1 Tax=Rhodococcoides corynebacterioides TaxID=53972 RepID=A0ABS2KUE0_9NOCA|nr:MULTISPECIES: CocE/NonD family hydrolase [Rhodococcus]MBM7415503.1 putative CocE/NonD family hydrolase [Rhodococcus corynebacterioides]MBP1117965.1 putative CocE/NonD family hydrolase [Rhodococcus sp. PvP016]
MFDISIEKNVPATMRDGVVLRADIYRPQGAGPCPVLLLRGPYGKDSGALIGHFDVLDFVGKGIIVVFQDTRGRFSSDGEFEPWTFEARDGYDTVEWAARLPGADGSVGMFGGSYLGNTQWMAAMEQPPSLKAVMPMTTFSDPHDGLFSRGGALELGLSLPWSLTQGLDTVKRKHQGRLDTLGAAMSALISEIDDVTHKGYWELPAGSHPAFVRHDVRELGFEHAVADPGWDTACMVSGHYDSVQVPSLNVGGWFDMFCQGTLDNFVGMTTAQKPSNLIMGPWAHTSWGPQIGDTNFGIASSTELLGYRGRFADIQAQWFKDQLRTDAPTGDEGGLPPVLIFVMGTNVWREEQEWPLARTTFTPLYLRGGGTLSFEAPTDVEPADSYVYDSADPVPTVGGAAQLSGEFRAGQLNQAPVEARDDVLCYTTEVLKHDVEVTGRVTATICFQSDGAGTDWVVRMCDVDEAGTSRNVVDGVRRTSALPEGPMECDVDLWSTSHVFRAGHRIRVHVTSSSFPRWDRNPDDVAQGPSSPARISTKAVLHEPGRESRVVIPLIPGAPDDLLTPGT